MKSVEILSLNGNLCPYDRKEKTFLVHARIYRRIYRDCLRGIVQKNVISGKTLGEEGRNFPHADKSANDTSKTFLREKFHQPNVIIRIT